MVVSLIQLFFRSNRELAYVGARHYTGTQNGKPQFEYHKPPLEYLQGKLNQIPKDVNSQAIDQVGHIILLNNDDLEKAHSSTILKKDWASSSVRIEHQP